MAFSDTLAHLFHPRRSNNHRPRVLHPEMVLFMVGFAAAVALAIPTFPRFTQKAGHVLGFSSSITAEDVVVRTNVEREKAGLAPLKVNKALSEAALSKATHMFGNQYWAHTAPDGTQPWSFFKNANYNYSVAGENLARDFMNAPDMMDAWMNSPTHKANIVSAKYQEIGIAVLNGELNGVETTLVVQFFGTPMSTVPQPQVAAAQTEADRRVAGQADVDAQMLTLEQQQPVIIAMENGEQAEVLSSTVTPLSNLTTPPLFSPLQLRKSIFLAVILIMVITLVYDTMVMQHKQNVRLVGKNFAHITFFVMIAFLVAYFKSGVIN